MGIVRSLEGLLEDERLVGLDVLGANTGHWRSVYGPPCGPETERATSH